jgi:hypothetical protein
MTAACVRFCLAFDLERRGDQAALRTLLPLERLAAGRVPTRRRRGVPDLVAVRLVDLGDDLVKDLVLDLAFEKVAVFLLVRPTGVPAFLVALAVLAVLLVGLLVDLAQVELPVPVFFMVDRVVFFGDFFMLAGFERLMLVVPVLDDFQAFEPDPTFVVVRLVALRAVFLLVLLAVEVVVERLAVFFMLGVDFLALVDLALEDFQVPVFFELALRVPVERLAELRLPDTGLPVERRTRPVEVDFFTVRLGVGM